MASACAKAEAAAERRDHGKTHPEYYFRHGYALEQMASKGLGRWQDAGVELRAALELDPSYAQAPRGARPRALPHGRR